LTLAITIGVPKVAVSLGRVATYRSSAPGPPARSLTKYSVRRSDDRWPWPSTAVVLMPAIEVGAPNGAARLQRGRGETQ